MASASHEDFSRGDEVKGSSDRSFGLVFVAAFLIYALAPLRKHQDVRVWALWVSGALLVISLVRPQLLKPFNYLWTQLALLLNKIVSPIAMGLIFFLVATPTGVLMRMFGKDPMRLRYDPSAKSYWQPRVPPGPPPASMSNQF